VIGLLATGNSESRVGINVLSIRNRIREAAINAGRNPDDISLVAVSKFMDVSLIKDAYNAGQMCFGENYAQELRDKIPLLPDNIRWHMIGPLQRNKVKYVARENVFVESVCDESIAAEIGKYALNRGITVPVLLQVNISGEQSKSGVPPENIDFLFDSVKDIKGIDVRGLMTIGSPSEDIRVKEEQFSYMQKLFLHMKEKAYNCGCTGFNELSMGMSSDFEIAVAYGATIVRVGSAIFGERRKNGI